MSRIIFKKKLLREHFLNIAGYNPTPSAIANIAYCERFNVTQYRLQDNIFLP